MLINANALSIPLADKSVHLVVTSPPYYGLRDYQIDGQIGLEQTPEEYVNNLVAVFREVRRVLADDGIVYLNLGDSYAGSGCGTNDYRTEASRSINKSDVMFTKKPPQQKLGQYGYKPKDLLGIPWMVAFALRADGWYLRDDIIWAKGYSGSMRGGAVMPESTKDRCTKAYEHIFMLTKKTKYYYDYYATLETALYDGRKDTKYKGGDKDMACGAHERWQYKNLQYDGQQPNTMHLKRLQGEEYQSPVGNPRNVWLINTKPFKGAHYAVFPPELVRLPILAGTSEKGHCPKCGARWERALERADKRHWTERNDYKSGEKYNFEYLETRQSNQVGRNDAPAAFNSPDLIDLGWQPTCDCGLEPVPDIVLDPFCGSGTTLMVAKEMGRQAIGLDLSFQYLDTIAKPRLGILLGG